MSGLRLRYWWWCNIGEGTVSRIQVVVYKWLVRCGRAVDRGRICECAAARTSVV